MELGRAIVEMKARVHEQGLVVCEESLAGGGEGSTVSMAGSDRELDVWCNLMSRHRDSVLPVLHTAPSLYCNWPMYESERVNEMGRVVCTWCR
jgi:hypothetical protein